jgi:hypothetical protein
MIDLHKEPMNTAVIRDPELIGILEEYSDLVKSIDMSTVEYDKTDLHNKHLVSEEYRKRVQQMGRGHNGFPEKIVGFDLGLDKFRCTDRDEFMRLSQSSEDISARLQAVLGANRRALSCVYPPGGLISWHNNANASGYNIILTWSEKGDGYWEHIDPDTGKTVRIPDVAGWQCKYGYFGHYDQTDRVLYHAAYTDCLRATVAYVFNGDNSGKNMAEMLIAEIETA